jgi:hypothetical protein
MIGLTPGFGFLEPARVRGGAGMLEAEKVQSDIQRVIADDPTIEDSRHVIVTVERAGLFKGSVIVLKGHVRSESDKAKIASVAHLHAAGRTVRDSITVTH